MLSNFKIYIIINKHNKYIFVNHFLLEIKCISKNKSLLLLNIPWDEAANCAGQTAWTQTNIHSTYVMCIFTSNKQ